MAQALILDSEALQALAQARSRVALADRARAVLRVAYEERALIRVPAPVLVEVCRGGARDSTINRLLGGRGIGVIEFRASCARRAGALLARSKLDSSHAVDAFVVATALSFGSAVIATGDPKDFKRLAAGFPMLRIFRV